MEFIEIQRKLVDTLLKIQAMETPSGRTSLLDGLPDPGLIRDRDIARLDLNRMVGGLEKMGRLTKAGGTRPLIVVVDNALGYVPAGSEIAQELNEVKRLLAEYYGGDTQAPVEAAKLDYEALVFGRQRDNRLAFAFAEGAVRTARSVARLAVPRIFDGVQQPGVGYGTGWLIAPGVVITNHHVIDNRDPRMGETPASPADFKAQAETMEALFDYYQEVGGAPVKCSGAQLLASNRQLDYAVIQLSEAGKVADRAALPIAKQIELVRGARMNLVQHARGGPLQYAIRNNFFVRLGDAQQLIRYQTDSEPGASGSPVCNDTWQVVGLHHASTDVPKEQVPQEVIGGQPVTVTILNEAIAIHSVLNDLPPAVKQLIPAAQPHS
jgi:endonuclease G, mitochondrial